MLATFSAVKMYNFLRLLLIKNIDLLRRRVDMRSFRLASLPPSLSCASAVPLSVCVRVICAWLSLCLLAVVAWWLRGGVITAQVSF